MFLVLLIIVVILTLWYYTSSETKSTPPPAGAAKTTSASETAAANLAAAEAPKGVPGSGSVAAGAVSAGSTSGNIPPVAIITTTTQANVATTVGGSVSSTTAPSAPSAPAPIVPKPSVVGTAVAVTGATATAGQLSSMLPTYTFYPGMTFGGNDLANTGLTDDVSKLAAWCDANAQCKGFTTDAWMKGVIIPQDKWYKWSDVPTKGLYVKK